MTRKDTIAMILYGSAGWFVAAMTIRLLGPAMFDGGFLHVAMLGIAALVAWPTVWLGAALLRRRRADMLAPVCVFTATAAFWDGLALTFTPGFYGTGGLAGGYAGGTILFGVAWLLLVALAGHRGTTGH